MTEVTWKARRIGWSSLAVQDAAKELRKNMTPSELRLWQALRAKRLNGLKFRRQHPIGKFIVDFCCLSIRLVVEVDGDIHNSKSDNDAARDACLELYGYRVLRIRNAEIIRNLQAVLARIESEARSIAPPSLEPGQLNGSRIS